MSAEIKTKIIRPKHFPECETCPIADKIVESWLHPDLLRNFASGKTESITVRCEVKGKQVTILHESVLRFRTVKDQEILVPGGNITPELVACPHFIDPKMKQASDPE